MRNRHFEIATNHIEQAKDEMTKCSDTIYNTLMKFQELSLSQELSEELTNALAALQMQDIVTQRLDKLKEFIQRVDEEITLPEDERYLDAFAWENEVDQSDIDALFNDHKG